MKRKRGREGLEGGEGWGEAAVVALSSVTHLAATGVPQLGPLTHLATSRHSIHENLDAQNHQCRLPDVTQVGGRWLAGVQGPSGGQGRGGGRRGKEVTAVEEIKRGSGRRIHWFITEGTRVSA